MRPKPGTCLDGVWLIQQGHGVFHVLFNVLSVVHYLYLHKCLDAIVSKILCFLLKIIFIKGLQVLPQILFGSMNQGFHCGDCVAHDLRCISMAELLEMGQNNGCSLIFREGIDRLVENFSLF